ncbi:hypothetical protein [Vibrio amylolyticus]|uniref:Rz1-like lysis system protein LysC n=1 Tax=Vibrio amylolyticus TaxID=2847292 RepID=UPI00355233A6
MKYGNSNKAWRTLIALFLMMSLSACANRIETTATTVIVKLPPAGLIVSCYKPPVIGTWPEVVTEDIPKLKAALSECSQQSEDYLLWRAEHESIERANND